MLLARCDIWCYIGLNMEGANTSQPVNPQTPSIDSLVKKVSFVGNKNLIQTIIVIVVLVIAGIGSGWILTGKSSVLGSKAGSAAKVGSGEVGIVDDKTFRDSAEGKLEEGGISGEGTHHLVREGGPSQNVYLTSTVIDLQSFIGKKVMVWGETIKAKKAGWLMDVGKVKVIE